MCENCKQDKEKKNFELEVGENDTLKFNYDDLVKGIKNTLIDMIGVEPLLMPFLERGCGCWDGKMNLNNTMANVGGVFDGNKYQIKLDTNGFTPEEFTIELDREERILTITAKHEVDSKSDDGSSRQVYNYMRVVENIPDKVDIFSVKKEFDGDKLIISGYAEEGCKTDKIIKL